jgi:hypothetical protein
MMFFDGDEQKTYQARMIFHPRSHCGVLVDMAKPDLAASIM